MRFSAFTSITLSGLANVQAKPFLPSDSLNLPTHNVAAFNETGTWFENVAIRPNGDLLATSMQPNPTLYLVKRPGSSHAELIPLFNFPDATGLVGITETGNDKYAVNMHNFSALITPVPDTGAVWEINFSDKNSDAFTTRKVTVIKGAGLLNGMTAFASNKRWSANSSDKSDVIIADTFGGVLRHVNLASGADNIYLDVPELKHPENGTMGVNGVRIRDNYVYWTNSGKQSLYRIAINHHGYPAEDAAPELLLTIPEIPIIDDFTFDERGNIWAAAVSNSMVFVVFKEGHPKEYSSYRWAAGHITSIELAGVTSTIFGRGKDAKTLFVTTSGGIAVPVNGTITEPAKIAAVDTSSFY